MSAKEKYLRRLLTDAEFYLNNIDGDDPQDPIGDVRRAGAGSHPVDTFVNDQAKRGADGEDAKKDANNENEVCVIVTFQTIFRIFSIPN